MPGNCKHCVYVTVTEHPNDKKIPALLNCHRYPPTGFLATVAVQPTPANPQGVQQAPGAVWPPVMEGQWCGEYAPKAHKGDAPS